MNPEHVQFTGQAAPEGKINVLSVFLTVDGETNHYHQGSLSVFVRLTGCRVGCRWCDTKYSWSIKQGKLCSPQELVNEVVDVARGVRKITLTGGEPLEQDGPALWQFLRVLKDMGFVVTIESAGAHPIDFLFCGAGADNIYWVLDYKLPSARAVKQNVWGNYIRLFSDDVIKFVVADRTDFEEAEHVIAKLRLEGVTARMVMSPIQGSPEHSLTPLELIGWMKKSPICLKAPVGLNMQLHKYIWTGYHRAEEAEGAIING